MHRSLVLALGSLVAGLALAACGDSGIEPGHDATGNQNNAGLDAAVDAFVWRDSAVDAYVPVGCDAVEEGTNTGFMVDGLERSFILTLPSDVATGGPFPVIFNWHGLGDTASNMNQMLNGEVDTAGFHFILVTPEDSNYQVYGQTIDWDVFQVNAETNREARLFDELLACLKSKYPVDENRVHSVGFSLGSILSDMLGTVRGDELASVVTFSGAYFSNPANTATLGMLSGFVDWPEPTHDNGYAQLLLHGGEDDTYDLQVTTIHFDVFAANDASYLNGLGHDVVICDHGLGHTAPAPAMNATQILEFLKDHPRGTTNSPYHASGLPGDFAGYCDFRLKSN